MQLSVPPTVAQNIARAKHLLGRNESIRALEAFAAAVTTFDEAKVTGRSRAGVEISIRECVDACNSHQEIRDLIRTLSKSDKAAITYTPGQEGRLAGVLNLLHKALVEMGNSAQRAAEEKKRAHKDELFIAAREAFRLKEGPKGRALLRRLGDEFGSEPGVLVSVGTILTDADFPLDAVAYLERAVAEFPRDGEAYGLLSNLYLELHEYEKCEKVYRGAVREFGMHPRTLTNLGKLYISWNKREKAFEVLKQASRLDPQNPEIAELLAKVDR